MEKLEISVRKILTKSFNDIKVRNGSLKSIEWVNIGCVKDSIKIAVKKAA